MGTFRLPAHRLDEAGAAMTRMIEASRAEDGCLAYAYGVDVGDPGLVHVVERWRDRAALDAHFQSPHIVDWRARWPSLAIGERDLVCYEVGDGASI